MAPCTGTRALLRSSMYLIVLARRLLPPMRRIISASPSRSARLGRSGAIVAAERRLERTCVRAFRSCLSGNESSSF